MSASTAIDIHCDQPGCGQWEGQSGGVATYARNITEVRAVLRSRYGWAGVGAHDMCPECVAKVDAATSKTVERK